VAEHRRATRERACDMTGSERRNERGREPLRDVEQDDRNPIARPERAPDVRPADVPAPDGPDVDTASGPYDPVSEREAAGEVAGDDEGESLDQCPFQ
jgi:hypothetical protein